MPASYDQLIDTVEAQLLIGPRGIGKTTLLKMLLPEALDAWHSPDGEMARSRIDYTGVFLQADKIWAGQFNRMSGAFDVATQEGEDEAALSASYAHRRRFGRASFAFMAFAAFAETAAYRCRPDGDESAFRWVRITRAQEEDLVAAIAPAWLAHPATSSFEGLAGQMRSNLSKLGQLMNQAGSPRLGGVRLDEILNDRLLSVDFYTAAIEFIAAFNHVAGDRYEPWVLLVDEFEFLPPAARLQIGEAFQGGDARLSYKVSLAPYTGIEPFAGSELNDWHKVALTHRSADDFSRRLLTRELASIGRPERVLKGRGFDGPRKDTFAKSGRNVSDIHRLEVLDESFRKWLARSLGGDPVDALQPDEKRYRMLRKSMPLVRLRLEHRERGVPQDATAPPTRVSELYAGIKNVYLLTEGNPRWIKALAYELRKRGGSAGISEARQAEAISHVARVLYGNLRAVSIQQRSGLEQDEDSDESSDGVAERNITPYGMLTELGQYLHAQTHEAPFSVEVAGVFRVERNDPWLDDVLNSLIFLGALVVEPRVAGASYERLRLAHMWAPLFELLMSRGKSRPLSKALTPLPLAAGPAAHKTRHTGRAEGIAARSGLVSDGQRRVGIRPWETRSIESLADGERYDGLLTSVGYEPRSCAIAEVLGPLSGRNVAVEFAEQRTSSYMRSLEHFERAGFAISRDWDGSFMPFVHDWLVELAALPHSVRVAIDVSSMNRKRIAAVVEVLAALRPAFALTAELLYAPARVDPPAGLPEGVITLAPVSAYFAGELQPAATAVGLIGVGYEPNKAAGALSNLEIPCAGVYVPNGPDDQLRPAVLEANRGLLESADEHEQIEYEILDPFDCISRLEGHSRALLRSDAVPVIIPLGPKIFALSSCIVAAIHHPRIQVWRASFDSGEEAVERVADGSVCGVAIDLAPARGARLGS